MPRQHPHFRDRHDDPPSTGICPRATRSGPTLMLALPTGAGARTDGRLWSIVFPARNDRIDHQRSTPDPRAPRRNDRGTPSVLPRDAGFDSGWSSTAASPVPGFSLDGASRREAAPSRRRVARHPADRDRAIRIDDRHRAAAAAGIEPDPPRRRCAPGTSQGATMPSPGSNVWPQPDVAPKAATAPSVATTAADVGPLGPSSASATRLCRSIETSAGRRAVRMAVDARAAVRRRPLGRAADSGGATCGPLPDHEVRSDRQGCRRV